MKIRLSYYLAGICFLWLSCSETTTLDQTEPQQIPLNFSVSSEVQEPVVGEFGDTTSEVSQAPVGLTKSYIVTTTNLTSFGVVSSYTGSGNFNTNTSSGSLPNSMYNVDVSRSSSSDPWGYSPNYYWPASTSNKLSFFAYAPHSSDCGGALTISSQTTRGIPRLYYNVPSDPTSHIDILAAKPKLNQTRSVGTVNLTMSHLLAKFIFRARKTSSSDQMYVTKIELTGLKGSGNIAISSDSTWKTSGTNTSYTLNPINITSDDLSTSQSNINLDNSTLFVMPQSFSNGQASVKITVVRNYNYFLFGYLSTATRTFSSDLSKIFKSGITKGGNYAIEFVITNSSVR